LSAGRLRLVLAPSAFLTIFVLGSHAAAALGALAVLPPVPGVLVALLLVCLGIATAWSRALLRSRSSVRALSLAGAKLEVELAGGESFDAEVAERRYVARYLVILGLRRPVRRTILVVRDMLDANSFRRLRIWALWGRLPSVAGKQLPA
jgi:toxin CptA